MPFRSRLSDLIRERDGDNQSAAARRTGIDVSSIRQYLAGTTPTLPKALAIARGYGVSLDWLVEEENSPRSTSFAQPARVEDTVVLPRYDIRASAGRGSLVVAENVAEYLSVGRDWLRRNLPPWAPPNAVVGVLEGGGDSMEPTIRDGDLIMVVQDVDWRVVERGGVFVFSIDRDRLLLKRLQVMNNGDLRIISDNRAYEPEIVPFADIEHRIQVHGQVFFVGGKPRSST